MSKLSRFVEGAAEVAAVQGAIINAMESVFTETEYNQLEAALLAPGYDGWEARALHMVKTKVGENWAELQQEIGEIHARYRASMPYPGQSSDFWVDPLDKPHLRVYWCLRCGYRVTSMALSGICCHGQPECPRCKHVVHEPNCRRKAPPAATPEKP